MLNCQAITRLLSESQERTLTLQERMSLKMHVMMCSGCRNFGKQMQTLRQVARAYATGADELTGKTDE
jgi:predicted anti-sigma-YlaC factor YlaD